MKNIKINEDGTVRINGKVVEYDALVENLTCAGECRTKDGKVVALFPFENGVIEYILNGSFASGESANYTELSVGEIMEYYAN
ncbi:MAG: hypothetical protein M0P47_09270 [Bacteroidales bacterium]|jgi:hypothetical protein|nr:hypothetical protein [Bacteroidales bacterium]